MKGTGMDQSWRTRRSGQLVLWCALIAFVGASCGDSAPPRVTGGKDVVAIVGDVFHHEVFSGVLSKSVRLEQRGNRFVAADTQAHGFASAPVAASGALRLVGKEPDLWFELVPLGRYDVEGELHGVVVYREAEPDTDVVVSIGRRGLEEFRVLRSAQAPPSARYKIVRGPAVGEIVVAHDRVLVHDALGRVAFKTAPAFAVDAAGRQRNLQLALDGQHLDVSLDPDGLAYPIVIDPSWTPASGFPTETVVGTQSVRIQPHSEVDGGVIVSGELPLPKSWNGVELAVRADATINGPVSAPRLRLGAGAFVDGDVRTNELLGHGSLSGELFLPVTLPFAVSTPDVPLVVPGNKNVRVKRRETVDLAPGHFRHLMVDGGGPHLSGGVLNLTGGVYHAGSLVIGPHGKVTCATACELRIVSKVWAKRGASLGPLDGSLIDASDIHVFVSGGQHHWSAHSDAVARFGPHTTSHARVFVPHGRILVNAHAHFTGKLVARRVKVGAHSRIREDAGDNPGDHGSHQAVVNCPSRSQVVGTDPLGAVVAHGYSETPGFVPGSLTVAERRFLRDASLRIRDDEDRVLLAYEDVRLSDAEVDGATLAPLVRTAARLTSTRPIAVGNAVARRVSASPADDGAGNALPVYRTWEIGFEIEGVPVSGAQCSVVAREATTRGGMFCRLPKGTAEAIETFTISKEIAEEIAIEAVGDPTTGEVGGRPTATLHYRLSGGLALARFFVSVYDGDRNTGVILDGSGAVLETFDQTAFQQPPVFNVTFRGWDVHYGGSGGYVTRTSPFPQGINQTERIDSAPAAFQVRGGRPNCVPVEVDDEPIDPLSLSTGFVVCENGLYKYWSDNFLSESDPFVVPRIGGDYTNIEAYRPDPISLVVPGILAPGLGDAARIPDIENSIAFQQEYLGRTDSPQSPSAPNSAPWHHAELQAYYNVGTLFERYRLFGHPQFCEWLMTRFPGAGNLCSVSTFTNFCPILGGCDDISTSEIQQLLTQDPYRLELKVHNREFTSQGVPDPAQFSKRSRAGLNHLHIADHPIADPEVDGIDQNVVIETTSGFIFAHEYQHHIMRSLELMHDLEPTNTTTNEEEPRNAVDEGLADAFAALMTGLEHDVTVAPRLRFPCADPNAYPDNPLSTGSDPHPARHMCNSVVYNYWETNPDPMTSFGWESHRRGSIIAGALHDFSRRFLDGGYGYALPGTFMYAPIRFLDKRTDDEHAYLGALLVHLFQDTETRRHRGLATVAFEKKNVFPNRAPRGFCDAGLNECLFHASATLAIAAPLNAPDPAVSPAFEFFLPQGPFYQTTGTVRLSTNASFADGPGELTIEVRTARPVDPPNNSPVGYARQTFGSAWQSVAEAALAKAPSSPRVFYSIEHCQLFDTRCVRTAAGDPRIRALHPRV